MNRKTLKTNMNKLITTFCLLGLSLFIQAEGKIDRRALLSRNSPQVTAFDSLNSLSVGNGEFAYTFDATGLQSFPEACSHGVPLGTQAQWAWHSFSNPEQLRFDETLRKEDFGHGHKETYSVQMKNSERQKAASDWYRVNPHRLHLGVIGFNFKGEWRDSLRNIHQSLDLWSGVANSSFELKGHRYYVTTACHPTLDMVAATLINTAHTPIILRFPYPTGGHCDDACRWDCDDKHSTDIVNQSKNSVVLKRTLDATTYYVTVAWQGNAIFARTNKNHFALTPQSDRLAFTCQFSLEQPQNPNPTADETTKASAEYWEQFWTNGAAVDFSHCTDPRARELERRVVLSQYLLAIQCAGSTPPQETGLTYNSWFGKFHLEMIYWHQAWLPLWNHSALLEHTLKWYHKAEPIAQQIAKRQGFKGIRWMKMTDPSGMEAPSSVGSYLIWQQPHLIQLAELVYRQTGNKDFLNEYFPLIQKTAEFMADFATYDKKNKRYILRGFIPAQETLKAAETYNAPFELSYWHYALGVAQQWRERMGLPREKKWDDIINNLSKLAVGNEQLYLAAESAPDTYINRRYTSDHMACLGALGILPMNNLIDKATMQRTLNWVWNGWNWDKTWGWDYPMTAMCATRLGDREKAVGALLMNNRTNTWLVSGHNYQDGRLRLYLPGNGGLLTAIALMCAGWDGAQERNPGFPTDGGWDVRWEGLHPLP